MTTGPVNQPKEEVRRVLSVDEVARQLGIGRNAAYAAVRAGQIPAVRVGRRWLVPRRALEVLLGEADGRRT